MIELIEKPRVGIIDVLDEEMKLPKPLDSHFAETLYNNHRYVSLMLRKRLARSHTS
jgi:myosin heavy subunit